VRVKTVFFLVEQDNIQPEIRNKNRRRFNDLILVRIPVRKKQNLNKNIASDGKNIHK
jgi:hypothetical protein